MTTQVDFYKAEKLQKIAQNLFSNGQVNGGGTPDELEALLQFEIDENHEGEELHECIPHWVAWYFG